MPFFGRQGILAKAAAAAAGAAAFTDDNDTVLLMHMDGSNNSTTFTDDNSSSRTAKTLTSQNGAKQSTAQFKYGTASLILDTTDDRVAVTTAADLNFSTGGAFTIECYVRSSTWATKDIVFWEGRDANNGTQGVFLWGAGNPGFYYIYKDNNIRATSSGDGTGANPTTNTWHHVAVTRTGGTHYLWHNGVEIGDAPDALNWSHPTTCLIGNDYSNARDNTDAYIDEFRVSDVARYTDTFTPGT